MGEAKRRKLLDRNFGKSKYKIKKIGLSNLPNITLSLLGFSKYTVKLFEITDSFNIVRTGNFHFYQKKGKFYAEFVALKEDMELKKDEYDWFNKHIDKLSPLLVKHELENAAVVIQL